MYGNQLATWEERQTVTTLILKHSIDSDDALKLWPADKRYHFSSEQQSALAYTTHGKAAVILGDPVGEADEVEKVINQFTSQCIERGVTPIFVQAMDTWQDTYKENGYKKICIGVDAQIDTGHFVECTARNKHFRNVRNRFVKNNYHVKRNLPPHNQALIKQLHQVSDAWLALPNRKEFRFIAGHFDAAYLQECTIYTLEDASSQVIAFANLLMPTRSQEITVDLMRFIPDTFRGAMDFLFLEIISGLHQEGIQTFNLGFSPTLHLKGGYQGELIERWVSTAYRIGGKFISFKGLAQYKAKFEPTWRERYAYYRGSYLRLPRMISAIIAVTRY